MENEQQKYIKITDAHQHNLKGINLDIPLNHLIVVTGVSGSGKSSLAFDTLYAEGQRRYMETFSPYARQFMERMDKPQVGKIEGIPPAIAIEQGNPVRTSRSTVGTITELADFVKLLMARIGELHCSQCGRKVQRDTPMSIFKALQQEDQEARMVLAFPLSLAGLDQEKKKQELLRQGFHRVLAACRGKNHRCKVEEVSSRLNKRQDDASTLFSDRLLVGDEMVDLDDFPLHQPKGTDLAVLVDRFILASSEQSNLIDSIEQALHFGEGRILIRILGRQTLHFSSHLHCPYCDLAYKDPVPNLFSFNSPLGACPTCRGFGRMIGLDLDLVIPNPKLTLEEGAIKPWGTLRDEYHELLRFCKKHTVPKNVPFQSLSKEHQRMIIEGTPDFYGVQGFFHWLERKAYKMHVRVLLSRYRGYFTCSDCQGTHFRPEALLYRLSGLTIAQIYHLSIGQAYHFFADLSSQGLDEAASMVRQEIINRLAYLNEIGLAYLTLDRQSRTLSGGEVERVSLTKALGSSLVNTLYVLDEPSVGLHPRDSRRLVHMLKKLSRENTVVVVEHDPEIIEGCQDLLDLGPGAGESGGQVVYFGPLTEIGQAKNSLTIDYLTRQTSIPLPAKRRQPDFQKSIRLSGAKANNLKDLNLTIPLGLMVCLTGVSGSGKSTLAEDIIYRGLLHEKGQPVEKPGAYTALLGAELLDEVILVDQSPLAKTPRSNPISYLGSFEAIRKLLAATALAKERGYTAGLFSFNIAGGRCEHCQGNGFEKVEMQFLSDVYVSCPQCQGLRFKSEILEVSYQGKNIHEILQMTFAKAQDFFLSSTRVTKSLQPIIEVGLGYLRLGQPLHTLSGGEAQRLKLAKYLSLPSAKPSLFIFDEPTTGLHFDDIRKLLSAFSSILAKGHTLLIIEHNLEVVKCADYVIDLGPEGGDEGGYLVAAGTPEEVAKVYASHTGRFLPKYLSPLPCPDLSASITSLALPSKETESKIKTVTKTDTKTGTITEIGTNFKPVPVALEAVHQGSIPLAVAETSNLADLSVRTPAEVAYQTGSSWGHDRSLSHSNHEIRPQAGDRDRLQTCPPGFDQNEDHGLAKDEQVIRITGAREHNLKNISLTIPRDQMVVITGLSGSGKSTLAFDVLFAEGQRRYIESLSTYIRQYLKIMERPDLDCISGIPPTVAIEQRMNRLQRRSTVATVTEIYHYLRLLYTKIGTQFCKCGHLLLGQTEEAMFKRLMATFPGQEVLFLAPKVVHRKGIYQDLLKLGAKRGYQTVRIDGHFYAWPEVPKLERYKEHSIDFGLHSLVMAIENEQLIKALLEQSLMEGKGVCFVRHLGKGQEEIFSQSGYCPNCGMASKTLDPRLFSFNSQYGACPVCEGLGLLLITGEVCPQCQGNRLKEEALLVKIAGRSIAEVTSLTVEAARCFCSSLNFEPRDEAIIELLLPEIISRLKFLEQVGLAYLTLDRSGETLSGGETQRLRLAAQLGSTLRGVCYILDEPTIGLHPRDNEMLLDTLKQLKKRGNSLVVVEHDEETIRQADRIIDLGPLAGQFGGRVIAEGTPDEIQQNPSSVTGLWLAQLSHRQISSRLRKPKDGRSLFMKRVRVHNLKDLNLTLPLGLLVCLTGVSGSGKSTLLREVLLKGVQALLKKEPLPHSICQKIEGQQNLDRVLEVDHSPIGKTPRSTPGTYIGFYDHIRQLFAQIPEARLRGYGPGRFSFNVKGGRCEACSGEGRIKEEMTFLPEVTIDCEVCEGRRFNEETLTISYKGKNIGQVLDLTIEEGQALFAQIPHLRHPLNMLMEMGLGYLKIGQPSNTLSGGEAQRIKLAYELCKANRGRTLYLLDEPTTGLHQADIEKLLRVLQKLVDLGNTVVVIEHNLEVIKEADYVIDLGPEGGDKGGTIVAEGTPFDLLAKTNRSYTAQFLAKYLIP